MTFILKSYPPGGIVFHTRRSPLCLVFALILAGVLAAHGAVLLNEPFNYSPGALVTVSGGGWNNHSGGIGEVQVVSGRAMLDRNLTEDVNTLLAGQPYPATTNTVLYASFTVNLSALPSAGGQFFAHFKNATGSNFRARIFALTSGAGTGQYRLGIANTSATPTATNTVNLNLNTDYQVYLRYGISNVTTTLWVDPVSEASSSATATDGSGAQIVTSFALRQDTGIGVIALDDLRVGTTFADVYVVPPVIPPGIAQNPSRSSAVEGGDVTFAVTATGSGPLHYQWNFNGTNLPAATNTTLTLNDLALAEAGQYAVTVTNAAGATNSAAAMLTVIAPNPGGTLSVVTYNVKGNFSSDWSTNAPQVQAIARELQYLDPDVILLNEIPNGQRYQMTNWMPAFFPGRTLAISPGTDGAVRSAVISRFPITRSQSWLANSSLTNFGYDGTYTRDLFEAEITVPGATEPLHVFTTHLKSAADTDSQRRRAAECSAVSNFFATVFLSSNAYRPYLLTGDLNEDIARPMNQNLQAIQRRVSSPTGLILTTPLNPFTLSNVTHSIQGSLDARFDYILPAGVLAANILASQVFRTDLLPSPPPPLLGTDAITASDHLPVQMIFNYPDPPLRVTLSADSQTVALRWPALVGRRYVIETSTNFITWTVAASNLVALASQQTWTATPAGSAHYYRVVRVP